MEKTSNCSTVLSVQQIPHGQQCSSFLCKLPRFVCPILTSLNWINKIYDHLNLIARKYKMTISSTKTKSMVMWGNHIQRVKIEINDIIEQVTDFKYLGYRISEYGSDLEDKL